MDQRSGNVREKVLVVDDDPSGLALLEIRLRRMDFTVLTARSVSEAQLVIEKEGIGAVSCVLTDYRMPKESGLDLLSWIQKEDSSLATIMITADGEKDLVKDSLKIGAVDFLEKPVTRQHLSESVDAAVGKTARNRRLLATSEEARAAGRMGRFLHTVRTAELGSRLATYYHPCSEVGGDFLNVHAQGSSRYLILMGDVAGHDLRAGFISAYFQGMVRGLHERKVMAREILERFNAILIDEWATKDPANDLSHCEVLSSLAVCALLWDPLQRTVRILNCGLPPCIMVRSLSAISAVTHGSPPLGWFDVLDVEDLVVPLADLNWIYLATDGLSDFAAQIGIDSLCLAYRLLTDSQGVADDLVAGAPDDILVMRLEVDSQPTQEGSFQPLIYEVYHGDEVDRIDEIQAVWRRSLQFALGDGLGSRLYDFLVCCREAVINAMVHGCDSSGGKACTFQVLFSPVLNCVRVRVDDPGKGHRFDPKERLEQLPNLDGQHLGLALIENLCDRFSIENNGCSLVFELSAGS